MHQQYVTSQVTSIDLIAKERRCVFVARQLEPLFIHPQLGFARKTSHCARYHLEHFTFQECFQTFVVEWSFDNCDLTLCIVQDGFVVRKFANIDRHVDP